MKKVKMFLVAAAAVLFAGQSMAQTDVRLGYLSNNVVTTRTVGSLSSSDTATTGFVYAGMGFQFPITTNFGLNVSGNVAYHQDSDEGNFGGVAGATAKTTVLNVSVPVLFNYGMTFGSKTRVTVFAGATLNLGVLNKTDYHAEAFGVSKDWSTNWYSDDNEALEDMNQARFNYGVTGGLRLDYGNVGLDAGYTHGLSTQKVSSITDRGYHHIFFGLHYIM